VNSSAEIDVLEYYGQFPDAYRLGTHVWKRSGGEDAEGSKIDVPAGSLVEGFHTYGVDIEPDWVTFYLDRKQVWRTKTFFIPSTAVIPEMEAIIGHTIERMLVD
jgi:beta-glucanase (GH16 family)